jgi:hypothetical protein
VPIPDARRTARYRSRSDDLRGFHDRVRESPDAWTTTPQ